MSIFYSQSPDYSPQVNISIFVNVEKAILNQSLQGCIFMMDDSPSSIGEGSAYLESYCEPGQMISWSIYPIENRHVLDKHSVPSVSLQHIQLYQAAQTTLLKNPALETRNAREVAHNINRHSGCIATNLSSEGHYRYQLQIKIQPQDSTSSAMLFDIASASLHVDKPLHASCNPV